MHLERFMAPVECKAVGGTGRFEGYAAIFGNVDLGADILERGAFKEMKKLRNGKIVVLNQHRQSEPIGVADVTPDEKGLHFVADLVLETASARNSYALMKAGALDGMSFGYEILPGGAEITEAGVRKLKSIRLYEISPVTFGMNPLAGVDAVKSVRSIREFESFLRDVGGYSSQQAKALASGGWRALESERDATDGNVKDVVKLLSTFQLPTFN